MEEIGSYCTHCGAKIESTSKFCPSCGRATPLAAVEEAGGAGERKKEAWVIPPSNTSAKTRKHIRNGRTLILISIAVILIGVVVLEYTFGIIIWAGVGLLIRGLVQYAYGKHRESKEEEES